MRHDDGGGYAEGPYRAKCNVCDYEWVLSAHPGDGWRSECPACGEDGNYRLDP